MLYSCFLQYLNSKLPAPNAVIVISHTIKQPPRCLTVRCALQLFRAENCTKFWRIGFKLKSFVSSLRNKCLFYFYSTNWKTSLKLILYIDWVFYAQNRINALVSFIERMIIRRRISVELGGTSVKKFSAGVRFKVW